MSHMYSFAVVQHDRVLDGDWHELLKPDPEGYEPVDGVEFLEGGQSMNGMFAGAFNEDTRGLWQAFLTGGPLTWDSNGRFVVLDARRRELLIQLKTYVPQSANDDTLAYHPLFRSLFAKMERVLQEHPDENLALVIN